MSRVNVILISLLAVFAIGFFIIWPQYQELRGLSFQIREKKVELQYQKEYFFSLRGISEELKNYQSELSKIDSAFPSDVLLPSLFNFLTNTASQNGLILKDVGSFSITSPEGKPEIKEISLNITVTGSYPAFKNFLSGLEKTARLVEVENISFSSPAGEEPFSFDLKIKTHSY